MLKIPALLAENYDGLYQLYAVIFLTPFAGAFLAAVFAKRWPTLALVFGVLGVIVGSLLLLLFAVTRGGALPVFWLTASMPFFMGIVCLIRWSKHASKKEPVQPPTPPHGNGT